MLREIDEQKPFPVLERHAMQRIILRGEARHLVHLRRIAQRAVEAIAPGVVRAQDRAAERALRLAAQAAATMPAMIVERADRPIEIAQHDDALALDLEQEITP